MIEEISLNKEINLVYYLPHRGILYLTKSTPLRAVFYESSLAKGCISPNDCMYKGLNFLSNHQRLFIEHVIAGDNWLHDKHYLTSNNCKLKIQVHIFLTLAFLFLSRGTSILPVAVNSSYGRASSDSPVLSGNKCAGKASNQVPME